MPAGTTSGSKYILGLELDDMGFDHSIFGRFRDRLLQSEKHKEAFFKLLELLVDEGLVKEKEKQRVDSTHIIANVAVPAATELIRQGVRQCLIEMKRKDHAVFLQARQTLTELVHQYLSGKMAKKQMEQIDETKRRQRLTAVVKDARELLAFLDKRDNLHPAVEYRRTILQRLLYENVMPDENGGYREQKESHPDRVISAVDPEARHGAKSATKKFNGYKVHFTESTENKIITNLKVTPGNVNDAEPLVDMVKETKEEAGLNPEKMLADGIYGTGENRRALRKENCQLVAPPHPKAIAEDLANGKFIHNPQEETVTCPAGITTAHKTYNAESESWIYRFPKEACNNCSLKQDCTKNKNGRTISVNKYYQEQMEALEYSRSEEYKAEIRQRCPIEGKGNEMVRHHGLRRARYWGTKKVGLQAFLTALAVNLKRWVNITLHKIKDNSTLTVKAGFRLHQFLKTQ
jgi:IS5 family transposase